MANKDIKNIEAILNKRGLSNEWFFTYFLNRDDVSINDLSNLNSIANRIDARLKSYTLDLLDNMRAYRRQYVAPGTPTKLNLTKYQYGLICTSLINVFTQWEVTVYKQNVELKILK